MELDFHRVHAEVSLEQARDTKSPQPESGHWNIISQRSIFIQWFDLLQSAHFLSILQNN